MGYFANEIDRPVSISVFWNKKSILFSFTRKQ